MHIVREMKRYNHNQVANALLEEGYFWECSKRRPRNIEKMVVGLPRCVLEKVLFNLKKDWCPTTRLTRKHPTTK